MPQSLQSPVGIFDSGLGGLSIWLECRKLMPKERFIYVADSAHCPYGNKSTEEIIALSRRITEFLINQGCKMIIVACNTATTAAIEYLRAHYDLPFVGIEPAVKPAAQMSQSGVIGVLATKGTINSEFYKHTREKFASDVTVIARAGEGLVEAVEEGKFSDQKTRELLEIYIRPMIEGGADQLVLGCTHYPFLIEQINSLTNNTVHVINPAPAVAKRAFAVLENQALASDKNSGEDSFYTSDSVDSMRRFLSDIGAGEYTVSPFLESDAHIVQSE